MDEVIKIKMVDPPSGWRYGFPKEMSQDLKSETEVIQWFLDNGYPQSLIDDGMLRYCRFWFIHKP
jgi:hypothetical protein